MNTTPDDLQQQDLMGLLRKAEPSWKTNPLPKDPSTEIFNKPAQPRRAQFSFNDPFGAVEVGGISSGGGGGGGNSLIPVTCTGVENGTPKTAILAAYQSPQ